MEALRGGEGGAEEEKLGKVDSRGRGVAAKVEEGPARGGEVEEVAGEEEEEGEEAWVYQCLQYLAGVTDEKWQKF